MPKQIKIIGLSGTNGAGKDTVGQILASRHNYLFISVTELLRHEARARKLPIERKYLREISAEWRRQSGLGVLVDKALEEFSRQKEHYDGLVIASLRNPGEADRLHELDGVVVWVDADPKVRYQRIQANKHHRGRHGEDNKTFSQFMAEEAAEMKITGNDKATLNMLGVKAKSDIVLDNTEGDLDHLTRQIDQALGLRLNL